MCSWLESMAVLQISWAEVMSILFQRQAQLYALVFDLKLRIIASQINSAVRDFGWIRVVVNWRCKKNWEIASDSEDAKDNLIRKH